MGLFDLTPGPRSPKSPLYKGGEGVLGNDAIQANKATAEAFQQSATAEPFRALYDKMAANPTIKVPDFETFRTRYSNEEGMNILWGRLSNNSTVKLPSLRDFKDKYSPAVTEAGILSKAWKAVSGVGSGWEYLIRTDKNYEDEETAAKKAAAVYTGITKNLTASEIATERAKQKEIDKTPDALISGIMLGTGPKGATTTDQFGNYKLPNTGNQVADIAAHTAAQAATKRAQDLVLKSGYTFDPKTGQYVAGDPIVPLEDLQKEYSQVYLDLQKTEAAERAASIKKNSDRWEEASMNSPTLLHRVWRLTNALFDDPAEEDKERLDKMNKTMADIKSLGLGIAQRKQREPDMEIAKAAFLPAGANLQDAEQVKSISNNIDLSTNALKKKHQTIQTDPNWVNSQVIDGVDQRQAVDDHANKDFKNQLLDNSMRALDKETFIVQSANSYKNFLQSTRYDSNKQLEQIDKDINGLINLTKGTRLTDQGEEYLKTLQGLRIKLKDNLTAQDGVIEALNTKIGDNSTVLASNNAQKFLIDKQYDDNNWSLAPVDRFITGQSDKIARTVEYFDNASSNKGYRGQREEETAAEYVPLELRLAKEKSLKIDTGKDAEGKNLWERIHVNKLGLFHTAIEQAVISAELGVMGSVTLGSGAALLGGAARLAAGARIAQLASLSSSGSKAAQFALWSGRGLKGVLGGAIDTGTGFIAPSILLFSAENIEAEMKNGRSAEDAIRIGVVRAGIEGLTERINPFEMNLLRGRVLTGVTKNLGEDVIFKNLTAKNGLSKRAFDYIYGTGKGAARAAGTFAKEGLKQINMEAIEEDMGLFLNNMLSKSIQKGKVPFGFIEGDATYKNEEPFNLQNLVNTHVLTMATMAGHAVIGGGYKAVKEWSGAEALKNARFMVANSPDLYKSVIAEKLVKGLITKDEAVEAIDRVDALHDTLVSPVIKAEVDVIMADKTLSKIEKNEKVSALFDANYEFQNHAKIVANLSPEERSETLSTINDELFDALKKEKREVVEAKWRSKDVAEFDNPKVAALVSAMDQEKQSTAALDAEFSAERINKLTDLEPLKVTDQQTGAPIDTLSINGLLTKLKARLTNLEGKREEDQPFNYMEKLKTIIQNLEVRKRAVEAGGTSEISKSNPQFLETDVPEPVVPTAAPVVPPVVPPVIAPVVTLPPIVAPPPPTAGVVAPAITIAPVVTAEEEAEEEEPDTSGEAMPNEAALREMHAKHYEGKRAKSFESWLNTKAGKKAVASLNRTKEVSLEREAMTEKEIIETPASDNNLSDEEIHSDNVTTISRLGAIYQDDDGNFRTDDGDGGYVDLYDGRATNIASMMAFRAREFSEDPIKKEESNTLNAKFDPILAPNGLLPGTTLLVKVNPGLEFVADAKKALAANKAELVENAPDDKKEAFALEIDRDIKELDDNTNFVQLDVFTETGANPVASIHLLSYINSARVFPEVYNIKGELVEAHNLYKNYQELKAYRASIFAAIGKGEVAKLEVIAKGNGYIFAEKDKKSQSTTDAIKNKDVLNTIQVSKEQPSQLALGDKLSINKAVPGGTYILIPTGNGSLFAWQLNAKRASQEVVDSYMAAIDFFEAFQSASLDVRNKTLLPFIEDMPFDISTIGGLREYLNNLIPSSSLTSVYTQDFGSRDTQNTFDKMFIDIQEAETKLTFSTTRFVPDEYTANPTPNLESALYEKAGIYRITLGKPIDPKLKDLLREHLMKRRVATNFTSYTDHKDSDFSLPLITVNNGKFGKVKESDAKQKYTSYKQYLKENTTTTLLEHKTSTGAHAYFSQPSLRAKVEVVKPPVTTTTTKKSTQAELEAEVEAIKTEIASLRDKDGAISDEKRPKLAELISKLRAAERAAKRGNNETYLPIQRFSENALKELRETGKTKESPEIVTDPASIEEAEMFIEAIIQKAIATGKTFDWVNERLRARGYSFFINIQSVFMDYVNDRINDSPEVGNNKASYSAWRKGKTDEVQDTETEDEETEVPDTEVGTKDNIEKRKNILLKKANLSKAPEFAQKAIAKTVESINEKVRLQVIERAYEGITATPISKELGLTTEQVRSIRTYYGVPDIADKTEYQNWKKNIDTELAALEQDIETEDEVPDTETETDEVPESVVFYRKLKAAKTYTEAKALIDSNPAYPGIQASIDAVLKKLESTKTYEEKKADFEKAVKLPNEFFFAAKAFSDKSKFKQETKAGKAEHDALTALFTPEGKATKAGYTLVRDRKGLGASKIKYKVMSPNGTAVKYKSFPAKLIDVVDGKIQIFGRLMGVEEARPFMTDFEYDPNGEHDDWNGLSNEQLASAVAWLNKGRLDKYVVQHMLGVIAQWLNDGMVRQVNSHVLGIPIADHSAYKQGAKEIEAEVEAMTDEEVENSPEFATFEALTEEEKQQIYDQIESTLDFETESYDYEEEDVAGEPEDEESTEARQPEIVEPEIVIAPEVRAWATLNIEEFTEEPVTQAELEEIQAVMFPEGVPEAVTPEVVITPEDRIIFGHPTIGKSFLKKQGGTNFITLDDDYADEVNAFVDANRGDKTRQEYKGSKPAEYNKFMLDLYDRLKAQAAKEGKVLFVSNTNILKERMADFDKVITMSKDEFKKRLNQRGSTYDFEDWKSDIDDAVSKVDKSKVLNTDKYLSDLLPPVEDHKDDFDKAEAEIAAEKAADTAARELEVAKIKQAVKDTKLTKAEKKVIADVAVANGAPDVEIFLQNAVVATNAGAPLNLSGPRKLLNKFNEIVKRILKNLVLLAVIVNLFMGSSSVYQPNSVSLKQVSAIEIPADITSENELIKNSYQVAKAKSPDQTVVILDKALAKIFVIDTSGKTLFEGAAVFGKDSGDIHDKNIKFDSFQDTAWLSTNQRITPTGAFTATKVTDSVYGGGNYFDIHGTVRRGKGDVAYAIKDAANKIAEKITGDTTDVFTLGNKPFGVITAFHGMVMKPGRIAAMKTKTSEDNMVTTGCFSILPADMARISPHMTDKISVVVIPAGAARTSFKMYLESQAKGTVLYSDWVNSMETTKAAEAEKEEKKTPVKAPMTAGVDALALAAAMALKNRKKSTDNKSEEDLYFKKDYLDLDYLNKVRSEKETVHIINDKLADRIDNYLKSNKFSAKGRNLDEIAKIKPFYLDEKVAIIRNKKGNRYLKSFTLFEPESGEVFSSNFKLKFKGNQSAYVETTDKVSAKRTAVSTILKFNKKLNDDIKKNHGWDLLKDLKEGNYAKIDSYIDGIIDDIRLALKEATTNNINFNKQYKNKFNLLASKNNLIKAVTKSYFEENMPNEAYQKVIAKLESIPEYFWNNLDFRITDDPNYDTERAFPFLGVTTSSAPMMMYKLGRDQKMPLYSSFGGRTGSISSGVDFQQMPIAKKSIIDRDLMVFLSAFAEKESDISKLFLRNENFIISAFVKNVQEKYVESLNFPELFKKVDELYRIEWEKNKKVTEHQSFVTRFRIFESLLLKHIVDNKMRPLIKDVWSEPLNKFVPSIDVTELMGYEERISAINDSTRYRYPLGKVKFEKDIKEQEAEILKEIDKYFKSIPNFKFLRSIFQANKELGSLYTKELGANTSLTLGRHLDIILDRGQLNDIGLKAYVLTHEIGHAFHLLTEVFGKTMFYEQILKSPEVKSKLDQFHYSNDTEFKELVADTFALAMLHDTGIFDGDNPVEHAPFPKLYQDLKDIKIKVGQHTLTEIENIMVEKRLIKKATLTKTRLSWDHSMSFLDALRDLINQIVDLIKKGFYTKQIEYGENVMVKIGEKTVRTSVDDYKSALDLVHDSIFNSLQKTIPEDIHITNNHLYNMRQGSEDVNLYMKNKTDSNSVDELGEISKKLLSLPTEQEVEQRKKECNG